MKLIQNISICLQQQKLATEHCHKMSFRVICTIRFICTLCSLFFQYTNYTLMTTKYLATIVHCILSFINSSCLHFDFAIPACIRVHLHILLKIKGNHFLPHNVVISYLTTRKRTVYVNSSYNTWE